MILSGAPRSTSQNLAGNDTIDLASVLAGIAVIIVGNDIESRIRYRPERKISIVKIYDVRIVVIDELNRPIIELVCIFLVGRSNPVKFPVPGTVVLAERMRLFVELLRIKAFPPFALAVFLGQHSVIRHALQRPGCVAAAAGLIPAPGVSRVNAHTERKVILAASLSPLAYDVAHRSYPGGIPFLITTVIKVEVVVMVGKSHKIAGAY